MVTAWQESVSLRPPPGQAALPPVAISPDYDALQFDMQWTTEDGVKYDYGLTAQMVQDRLLASWGKDADFHISAGAFGSVRLLFRTAQSFPEQAVREPGDALGGSR